MVGVVTVGVAVVGGVRGVIMTSDRRGDLILLSTESLEGV